MRTKITLKKRNKHNIYITMMAVDDAYRTIHIQLSKNGKSNIFTIPYEKAEEIGLINLDALNNL